MAGNGTSEAPNTTASIHPPQEESKLSPTAELVEHIVLDLVNNPDDVRIEERSERDGVVYDIHVAPNDRGIVIGRGGCHIQAIRCLISTVGRLRDGRHAFVRVLDA